MARLTFWSNLATGAITIGSIGGGSAIAFFYAQTFWGSFLIATTTGLIGLVLALWLAKRGVLTVKPE